jgi:cephalosporin hydroxylase
MSPEFPDYFAHKAHKHFDIRNLPDFNMLARKVIDHKRTLLYYDRLYTIYQSLLGIARMAVEKKPVNLAEVGVYKGGGCYFIASVAASLGLDLAAVHGFDTFKGHHVQDVRLGLDTVHKAGVHFMDTEIQAVKDYLSEFDRVMLYKGRFQETADAVSDQRFLFVHLDVDIYEPTRFALDFFDRRLEVGGVVVVDDYGFRTCPGVKAAVDEFIANNPGYFALNILTGQMIMVKHQEAENG